VIVPLSAAERLLKSLAIETPDEIDLEVIAWQMGIAAIKYRKLDGCEARIVGRRGRAIVSVREGVRPTRQRFSICHELGHWHHHRGQFLCCKTSDIGEGAKDVAQAKEAVANRFASDLLLPSYLLRPVVSGAASVDVKTVEQVAELFKASLTASAIKLIQIIATPSMLVCHSRLGKKWHFPGPSVPRTWSPKVEIDQASPGFGMLFQNRLNQPTPRRVSAHAWFDRRDADGFDVWEQSFKTIEGEVLTILTFKDPKMFDSDR
jgi:hypothetical protein